MRKGRDLEAFCGVQGTAVAVNALIVPRQRRLLSPRAFTPKSCKVSKEKNCNACRKVKIWNWNYQTDLLGFWGFLPREKKNCSEKYFIQSFPVTFLLMFWMMGQGVPSASLVTENREEQLMHQRAMLPSRGSSATWRNGLTGPTSASTRGCANSYTCGTIKKPPCSRTCRSQKAVFQKRTWTPGWTWGNT